MKLPIILLIQGFIEIAAGLLLSTNYDLFFLAGDTTQNILTITRLYAIAALLIGGISLIMYRHFEYNLMTKFVVLFMMLFHLFIGFHLVSSYQVGAILHVGPGVLHLMVAALVAFAYYNDKEEFPQV